MLVSEINEVFFREKLALPVPCDVTIFRADKAHIHLYGAVFAFARVFNPASDTARDCEFEVPIYSESIKDGLVSKMRVQLDLGYAIVWEKGAGKWFDEQGMFCAHLPEVCIQECAGRGDVTAAVESWQELLHFEVPRKKAIDYLVEYGAWDEKELNSMPDSELSCKCLWLACGDIVDERNSPGEPGRVTNWLGFVH